MEYVPWTDLAAWLARRERLLPRDEAIGIVDRAVSRQFTWSVRFIETSA